MAGQIPLVIVLSLIGATLCALMALAWRSFDRPPHARLWAWAFGLATVQWLVNLAYYLAPTHPRPLFLAVNWLSIAVSVLWLEGFRRRAGRAAGWSFIAGALSSAAAVILLLGAVSAIAPELATILAMLVRAALLVTAATMIVPANRPGNGAERGTIAFLMMFCGFSLSVAAFAMISVATGQEAAWEIARGLLRVGLPVAFTGLGLFAVFLLASDLCEQMRGLAAADPLTGLLNRRGFDEAARRSVAHARRLEQPATLIVADVDGLKAINDRLGHAAGDLAIRRFSNVLRDGLRTDDLVARIGGDEFVMLLLGTDASGADEVIHRLRVQLAGANDGFGPLTGSFGIATIAPGEPLELTLARADEALYRSKQQGRDCVTVAPRQSDLKDAAFLTTA